MLRECWQDEQHLVAGYPHDVAESVPSSRSRSQQCFASRRASTVLVTTLALTVVCAAAVASWHSAVPYRFWDQATLVQSKVALPQGPIFGGKAASDAFTLFRSVWRDLYRDNSGVVPELANSDLPEAFLGVTAKVVVSSGGVAEGGVVSEGIGYGIMVEGVQAAAGDRESLSNGLALMKAWLGMVQGPKRPVKDPTHDGTSLTFATPVGGGNGFAADSATKVDVPPYGVSAIAPQGPAARGPSGVAAWKYPIESCSWGSCTGSATDGDEDAVFGMIYLAHALDHPPDFMDTVMRALISVASADLGFPDLYRTLPDGTKVFVPRGGSKWGGLTPAKGKFKASFNHGCINPSYFAPASYRLMRDFAKTYWKPEFDVYLPPHVGGEKSSLTELVEAFNGAIVAGYNLFYRSSCSSGVVSNWAGSRADCKNGESLNCPGVPWATTPHVGKSGTCTASGTKWGSWGKDACRAPWRIAMDYVLYPDESVKVAMYGGDGLINPSINFNSKVYLNNLASWYKKHARCDGGSTGSCISLGGVSDPNKLAAAFVMELGAPKVTCGNVPFAPEPNWWAAEMSHPTFASFVAPLEPLISRSESSAWLDTFAMLCNMTNFGSYDDGDTSHGILNLCSKTYFQASQQVISAMVSSGTLQVLGALGSSGKSTSFDGWSKLLGASSGIVSSPRAEGESISLDASGGSGSSPSTTGGSSSRGGSSSTKGGSNDSGSTEGGSKSRPSRLSWLRWT